MEVNTNKHHLTEMKMFVSEEGKVGRLKTIGMNKKKSQRKVTIGAVKGCPAQEEERMTHFQVKITKLAQGKPWSYRGTSVSPASGEELKVRRV